jgi:hypothetical protein
MGSGVALLKAPMASPSFAIVIPFTCVVLIANITAIIAVSLKVDRRRNPLLVLAIVATTIIWLGAVAFDYYMTTRPVTGQCP